MGSVDWSRFPLFDSDGEVIPYTLASTNGDYRRIMALIEAGVVFAHYRKTLPHHSMVGVAGMSPTASRLIMARLAELEAPARPLARIAVRLTARGQGVLAELRRG